MLGTTHAHSACARTASACLHVRRRRDRMRNRKVSTMKTTTKWRSFATYWQQVFHAALSRGSGIAHAAHPPDLYRSTPQHGPFLR